MALPSILTILKEILRKIESGYQIFKVMCFRDCGHHQDLSFYYQRS